MKAEKSLNAGVSSVGQEIMSATGGRSIETLCFINRTTAVVSVQLIQPRPRGQR